MRLFIIGLMVFIQLNSLITGAVIPGASPEIYQVYLLYFSISLYVVCSLIPNSETKLFFISGIEKIVLYVLICVEFLFLTSNASDILQSSDRAYFPFRESFMVVTRIMMIVLYNNLVKIDYDN